MTNINKKTLGSASNRAPSAKKVNFRWSTRTKVADLDRTYDDDGDLVLWSGMVEDRDCAYLLQQNPNKDESNNYPHYKLIEFAFDKEEGAWGDELELCGLWKTETATGKAEPVTISAGTNRAKTLKYSVWKDRTLSDGTLAHTLYEQVPLEKGDCAAKEDDFLS